MPPARVRAALVPAAVAVALCSAGCAGSPVAPSAAPPVSPAASGDAGGHGRGGGAAVPAGVPAGRPADVPVPPGTVTGSTGAAGRWTVQLQEPGAAGDVQRSAVAFYVAAGFTADPAQVLRRGAYAVTVAAENRDHSATATSLSIGVVRH